MSKGGGVGGWVSVVIMVGVVVMVVAHVNEDQSTNVVGGRGRGGGAVLSGKRFHSTVSWGWMDG